IGDVPGLSFQIKVHHIKGLWVMCHPASCGHVLASEGGFVTARCRCWWCQCALGPLCWYHGPPMRYRESFVRGTCEKCGVSSLILINYNVQVSQPYSKAPGPQALYTAILVLISFGLSQTLFDDLINIDDAQLIHLLYQSPSKDCRSLWKGGE
ncbi:hypothetical protein SK128_010681, partial [Halocaridina rubra]